MLFKTWHVYIFPATFACISPEIALFIPEIAPFNLRMVPGIPAEGVLGFRLQISHAASTEIAPERPRGLDSGVSPLIVGVFQCTSKYY